MLLLPTLKTDPDLLGFLPAPTVAAIVNVERLKKAEDKEKGHHAPTSRCVFHVATYFVPDSGR